MSSDKSALARPDCVVGRHVVRRAATTLGTSPKNNSQSRAGQGTIFAKLRLSRPGHPAGDGLGPLYNDVSCAACHFQGGLGGGGPQDKNVRLLSSGAPKRARCVASVHPALGPDGSIVLHRFSSDNRYADFEAELLGIKSRPGIDKARKAMMARAIERRRAGTPVVRLPNAKGTKVHLSQRNTTSLFGLGLIDAIPTQALTQVAEQQAKQYPDVSGRVAPAGEGLAGKFGWRGQVASLEDFVLTACAVELGLETPDHRQSSNPQALDYKSPGLDLTEEQCEALVAFVASLPPPQRIMPADREQAFLASSGEQLFETIGCAACHVRKLGDVDGIYSDLLLHDLGPDLADPVPARPQTVLVGTTQVSGGAYGGGSVQRFADIPSNVEQEWKTPPLWGVRDSAPYLHDGRAATLEAAILQHGGEARFSAERFAELSGDQQLRVLAFVNAAGAPNKTAR